MKRWMCRRVSSTGVAASDWPGLAASRCAHALHPGCRGCGWRRQAPHLTALVSCKQVRATDVGAASLISFDSVNSCLVVAAAPVMVGGGNVDGYRLVMVVWLAWLPDWDLMAGWLVGWVVAWLCG